MRIDSRTSDHRWYLLMMPQSRLFLQLGELMQIPGWLRWTAPSSWAENSLLIAPVPLLALSFQLL